MFVAVQSTQKGLLMLPSFYIGRLVDVLLGLFFNGTQIQILLISYLFFRYRYNQKIPRGYMICMMS
jgi:hypothetical protein